MIDSIFVVLVGKCLRSHIGDFVSRKAVAEIIVDKEIVEFVGTDFVFGDLGNITILVRRQQFGRDWGIDDIQQDTARILAKHILRRIAHHIAHEGLRNTRIDTVHRHLVARIGSPPEGKFAQVARADHDAVVLVRHIHQDKRTDTRLGVLIGNIVGIYIVPDVGKVLRSDIADRNLVGSNAELLHHSEGILISAVAGAEARHSDTEDTLAVVAEVVRRQDANQKCQRGIQTARDSDDDRLGMCMLPTAHQSARLDREDIHTIGIFIALGRQERSHGESAV